MKIYVNHRLPGYALLTSEWRAELQEILSYILGAWLFVPLFVKCLFGRFFCVTYQLFGIRKT